MKEHQDACKRGEVMRRFQSLLNMLGSSITPIKWEEVRVVDRASRNRELKIKEALHIQI